MSEGLIEGFERCRLPGHEVEIDALVGGSGPPLLLLHGYPQTRVAWRRIAPLLAKHFSIVIPDLRGYGRSDKPQSDERHERYSKRIMALDQIKTMQALGHHRFAVVGHDRGARVGYRLALDHPDVITKIAVLDIIPTADMWASANADSAMRAYHLYLLAQPAPLPEKLIASDPDFFIRWMLCSWAGQGFEFDPESLEDYLVCFRDPASIHGTCEDYRAGWTRDREQDECDRGHRTIDAPLLVLWGEQYSVAKAEPLKKWSEWVPNIQGHSVPGGHFICEESPNETANYLADFFR